MKMKGVISNNLDVHKCSILKNIQKVLIHRSDTLRNANIDDTVTFKPYNSKST